MSEYLYHIALLLITHGRGTSFILTLPPYPFIKIVLWLAACRLWNPTSISLPVFVNFSYYHSPRPFIKIIQQPGFKNYPRHLILLLQDSKYFLDGEASSEFGGLSRKPSDFYILPYNCHQLHNGASYGPCSIPYPMISNMPSINNNPPTGSTISIAPLNAYRPLWAITLFMG